LLLVVFRGGNPPPTSEPPAPPSEVPPEATKAQPLEIWFLPEATDPERAADLRCHIATGSTNTLVTGPNRSAFVSALEEQIDRWLGSDVDSSAGIWIYMRPYPGEGVFEQVQAMARRKGIMVTRIDTHRSGGEVN
jgi:hypothetical protein